MSLALLITPKKVISTIRYILSKVTHQAKVHPSIKCVQYVIGTGIILEYSEIAFYCTYKKYVQHPRVNSNIYKPQGDKNQIAYNCLKFPTSLALKYACMSPLYDNILACVHLHAPMLLTH